MVRIVVRGMEENGKNGKIKKKKKNQMNNNYEAKRHSEGRESVAYVAYTIPYQEDILRNMGCLLGLDTR